MTVAVIGSRTFTDRARLFADLDALRAEIGDFTVISGGARGADTFAKEWANERGLPFEVFRPNYKEHGGQRGRAEMIRNREIVQAADRVIAYWDGLSMGTAATIRMARSCACVVVDVRLFGSEAP